MIVILAVCASHRRKPYNENQVGQPAVFPANYCLMASSVLWKSGQVTEICHHP